MQATYINESQFSLVGNQIPSYRIGTKVVCEQGTDEELWTDVTAAIYNAGDDITIVTVKSPQLTSNLSSAFHGHTFKDPAARQSNISDHDHSEDYEGGKHAFSGFTDENKVTRLNAIASIGSNVANFVQGINADGTGVEKKAVLGTANRVTVTHDSGKITLSLPQDFDVAATPTLVNLILTGLRGALIGNGAAELSCVDASAGQVVVKMVDNSGYEAVNFTLSSLKDVIWGNPLNGDSLVYDAVLQKAKFTRLSGGGGANIGTVLGLLSAFGSGDDGGSQTQAAHGHTHIDGATDPVDGDKLEISFSPTDYFPALVTDITNETDQLTSHLKGIEDALHTPDPGKYCPKPFLRTSATQILIPAGTYYACGYRHRMVYEKFSSKKIILTNGVSRDLSSGMVGNSWYSVFVTSPGTPACAVFPVARVKSSTLDGSNTRVYIGKHEDYTQAENGFLTANDAWTAMRLVKMSEDAYDGNVYEIADSVNQDGDYVILTGDKTSEILAGDWLFLVPPADNQYFTYACLYLGMLRTDSSGNVMNCVRKKASWDYWHMEDTVFIPAVLGTSPGNTSVSAGVPPNANTADLDIYVASMSVNVNTLGIDLYNGNDGTYILRQPLLTTGTADPKELNVSLKWSMTYPCIIRNDFWQDNDPAGTGAFQIIGFSE